MPWVRFVEDFSFVPRRRIAVSVGYRKGMRIFVTRECAKKAIDAKKAEPARSPRYDLAKGKTP